MVPVIHNLPVPQKLSPVFPLADVTLSLHGFCDASSVAYEASVYARIEAPDGTVSITLILAKARVLPTKPITIPKAELSGAHLLAKMLSHLLNLFNLTSESVYAWTDSQIVLHWFPKSPSQLNRFVANRVAAIQELLPSTRWRHVPSPENPADLASREVRASELSSSTLWWNRPAWLRLLPDQWPPPFYSKPSVPIYSVSLKPCLSLSTQRLSFLNHLWSQFSNFFKLVRIVCYVCRFLYNCHHLPDLRKSGPLTDLWNAQPNQVNLPHMPHLQTSLRPSIAHSMGMLPESRTTPAPPFLRTGVDFAGPFLIKKGHTRRPVLIKSYAVVFVCLTTKAVHFDLCSSLSTDDFLSVLRRFIARRGCPTVVMSDNGTNFHGAREEFRELQKTHSSKQHHDRISTFCTSHGINWQHIPPRAPHFGGLWEADVKAMKTTLRKLTKPHPMTWEETYTLLTEAEGILNYRPLIPLSVDDTEDNTYLTPGHFLIGRPLLAMPTPLSSIGKITLGIWLQDCNLTCGRPGSHHIWRLVRRELGGPDLATTSRREMWYL